MEIKEYIKESSTNLFKCSENNGFLVLTTPFFYPDGDEIELFLEFREDYLLLSDFGETLRYLDTYLFDVFSTKKRKDIVNDIIKANNLRFSKGIIYAIIKHPQKFLDETINICQAIIRISDLLYTAKGQSFAAFEEEVKSFLDDKKLNYEEDYKVETSTNSYQFEFAIESQKGIKLLKLVNTPKKKTNPPIDRIVRIWFDISSERNDDYPKENRITLLDDTSFNWVPSQYAVVEKLSIVNKWTDKDRLLQQIS